MKPLSTKMHGVIDYLTSGTLLVLPRALGWSPRVTTLLTGMELGALGYSLLTRYELGLAKVLPMKAHLALDGMSGALLVAAPFLFRDEKRVVTGALAGVGLFEIAASLLTRTQPALGERASRAAEGARDAVREGA